MLLRFGPHLGDGMASPLEDLPFRVIAEAFIHEIWPSRERKQR